jgi:hypothetical protein
MGTGFLKAAVAITVVTCVIVIVVSPFVDLPLTIQNSKAHLTFHICQASVLSDSQLGTPVLTVTPERLHLSAESDKLDILVTYRC